MLHKISRRFLPIVVLGYLQSLPVGHLAAAPSSEYQVKAAALYKLTKFVAWPDSDVSEQNAALGICVLGRNRFGDAITKLHGKTARGKTVNVHRIDDPERALDLCQVVFVSVADTKRLRTTLNILGGRPILTVSDLTNFAELGGVIGFGIRNKRLRFTVNVDAAARQGLAISSQLLQLATVVHDDRGEETQ